MKPISLQALSEIIGAELHGPGDALISGFATDSGSVEPGDLFLAIRGARVDGHDYVADSFLKGATAALVERSVNGPHLLVGDLVTALSKYGLHYRASFHGPVVGITGSAGKTTTKEFLASALSPLGKVLKSEGNRNTELTSPLLWSELNDEVKAVVVEMGMRGFGQIAHLAGIAQPTVAIVTNIGYAHLLQMGSREGIARAKGEILESLAADGLGIVWHEDPYRSILGELAGDRRLETFGFEEGASCRITEYKSIGLNGGIAKGTCLGASWELELPILGRHVALDAAAALLGAVACGVSVGDACEGMRGAKLPPMRMEVRDLHGATLLLDNYNASPPSMISAIETLAELPTTGRRFAVLGEMRELGDHAEETHRMVGRALKEHPLDGVIFVGNDMRFAREELGSGDGAGTLDDVRGFLRKLAPGDAVLIKGSRALELEKALEELD